MSFGIQLKEKIIRHNLIIPNMPLAGCSDKEIDEVKAAQGVKRLPEVYVQFLKELGNNAGQAFMRHFYSYPSLLWMKKSTLEGLYEEKIALELPDDAFVFMDLDGKYHHFFQTENHDDDPLVFCLIFGHEIGEASIENTNSRLSGVLDEMVDGLAEAIEKHRHQSNHH
jgi:hypothetical protein